MNLVFCNQSTVCDKSPLETKPVGFCHDLEEIVTKNGLALIDTRYLLETDGALIYLQTKGYRYGPPDVMAR